MFSQGELFGSQLLMCGCCVFSEVSDVPLEFHCSGFLTNSCLYFLI